MRATMAGMIMGTAGYMSPEQDALREVLTANAELLVLWRKQQPPR
jgi:hypothetical protein